MKMRSHIWFQFHIRTVLSGVPMWIAAFTSLSKTSVSSTCSACSAVLWFHSESKHLLRDKPNPKHSLLVTFWNWTLLYSKFIPQGESVQFVPWRLREGIEKTAWTVAHTCMSAWGTLKTGEVFGHTNTFFTYHRDNYLPPTLPYCNFVHLIRKKNDILEDNWRVMAPVQNIIVKVILNTKWTKFKSGRSSFVFFLEQFLDCFTHLSRISVKVILCF